MKIKKNKFKLKSKFKPTGDQPDAIKNLVSGIDSGKNMQTLLGVTGSGKTFTMANVIAKVNRPTLIMAHNKTLAAQLYEEMREFFPDNRVEYFISYYDYYQPESYLPAKDQYIEKDSAINPRIEMMRHATVASLLTRSDVIVVASVSCIYGMSDPKMFRSMGFAVEVGEKIGRRDFISKLVGGAFERNDLDLIQGRFRVKGDTLDFIPGYSENIIRVEFFGDEVEKIFEIDKVTGERLDEMKYFHVWPARNYVVPESVFDRALAEIRDQLKMDLAGIDDELVKHRLKQRTLFDLEMIGETGRCKGIENYSRHFDGRVEGEQAFCLLDYFPKNNFLMIIDESHRSVPQVGGMFNGDKARKKSLIDYGFRLTSAYDNRPLRFGEFEEYMKGNSTVFVSATPGDYEGENASGIVEQIIRPTGLVDPRVEIRPISPRGDGKRVTGDGKDLGNVVIVHGSNEKDREKVAKGFPEQNKRSWFPWIKSELEKNGIETFAPLMPENWKPDYEKWKGEFEKININEKSVLAGTSAGAAFLVRWLGDTKRKIKKLILVAPAYKDKGEEKWENEGLYDFKIDSSISKRVSDIVLIESSNDYETIKKSSKVYSKLLGAKSVVLENRGHFTDRGDGKNIEFPELLGEILGRPNVVIVHGSNRKDKERMETKEYVPHDRRHWLPWIKKNLRESNINCEIPLMPENWNPKYKNWKKEVDKINIDENSILVGTSVGAAFLVRWLGDTGGKIKKLILVAPVTGKEKCNEWVAEMGEFEIDSGIKDRVGEVVVFVSDNEEKERIESAQVYADKLGGKLIELKGRGHFTQKCMGTVEFPELLGEILTTDLTDLHGHDEGESYGGQVRDCLVEIDLAVKKGSRVLLTTLTKRMAEELTDFLGENGVKCRYMHSEIDTFERTEILRELRLGKFDVLVGINLLREGIDIPEIGFVGVLDADKEGFLRDRRSLIQIIGRAARNSEARVVLYADVVTGSIKAAVKETERRRAIQVKYNEENGIVPKTVVKPIRDQKVEIRDVKSIPKAEVKNVIIELEADMKEAAELLDFERAIFLRGRISELGNRIARN